MGRNMPSMSQLIDFVTNHPLLVGVFLVLLVWLFIEEVRSKGLAGNQVSSQQLTHMLNREQAKVVDIRDAQAFKEGHIIDSVNIPATDIEKEQTKLERFKQNHLVLVCPNGQKSGQMATQLRKRGFDKIAALRGGLSAWKNDNMPLVG